MFPMIPKSLLTPVQCKYSLFLQDWSDFNKPFVDRPQKFKVHEQLKGKKVVIFGIPGEQKARKMDSSSIALR